MNNEHSAPDQNPPVDPAALAETKVLPRYPIPEGFRWLAVGETLLHGDKFFCNTAWATTECAGELVPNDREMVYIRPIDPVPHTLCTKCGNTGWMVSEYGGNTRMRCPEGCRDPVPHTKGRDKATCPHCDMEIEAAEIHDYKIFKGWAAGCDTEGCPGELDERKIHPKKADAIAAACAPHAAPKAPARGSDIDWPALEEKRNEMVQSLAPHTEGRKNEGGSISGNALGEVARQAPERSEFETCPPVQSQAPEGYSPKAPAEESPFDREAIAEGDARYYAPKAHAPIKADLSGDEHELHAEICGYFNLKTVNDRAYAALDSAFQKILDERDRISTLTDALSKARGVLARCVLASANPYSLKAEGGISRLLEIMESPALVALTQPDGGAK